MSVDETNLTVRQARAGLRRVVEGGRIDLTAGETGSWSIRICGARFKAAPNFKSMPLLELVFDNCRFHKLTLDHVHARRVEMRACEGGLLSAVGLVIDGETGDLILEDLRVRGRVDLSRARIGGRLICRALRLLGDGDGGVLKCSGIEVGNDVDLIDDCYVKREVDFVGAEIGGTFTYTGQVGRGNSVAIRCDGIHVKRAFRIGDPDQPALRPTEVRGEVRLVEANVEGDVNLTRTRVINPDGKAIDAEHAIVGEDLYLDRGFVARGTVRLVGARVTQLVNCTAGAFHGVRGPAIDAAGLTTTGVRFDREREGERRRFSAEGAIHLEGAMISREVLCSGGRFVPRLRDESPVVIWAENMVCDTVRLDEDCQVRGGSIRLGGARIAGGLYCVRGKFHSVNGHAVIQADGAEFGSLFLRSTFVGEVSVRGTRVRNELNCTGGMFHNPTGKALTADRLACGHLYLNKSVANGIVSLWEATVEFVDCDEATIDGERSVERTPSIEGYETAALDLTGIDVSQHVLARRVRVKGGLRLAGGHIRGDLDLTGATVVPAIADGAEEVLERGHAWQGTTVDARRLVVEGTLSSWRLPWHPAGKVDMSSARVGLLWADFASWPGLRGRPVGPPPGGLNLNGLKYTGLETTGTAPVQQRLAWLASSRPFSQQPYEELARTYLERGQVSDARRVRLQEQRERTRRAKLPPLSKAWNLFLEWTVGYGYRPGRIWVILVAFAVAGGLLFHVAQHNGIMEAVSYHPDKCLERLTVPAPSGEGRQKEIPVEVEFRGGTPKAVVYLDNKRATTPRIAAVKKELPEGYKSLGPALNFQESAQLPPCRVQANRCTSFYPCFYPAAYSTELLIPVVNLRQLTYWLPDQNANSDGPWYLHGVWYLTFAWISIILGWVSVTALAAGISRAWRSD